VKRYAEKRVLRNQDGAGVEGCVVVLGK